MMRLIIGGTYEHVRTGSKYRVLLLAKDVKDLTDLVVYEALYENEVGKYWVRTKEEFLGESIHNDGTPHPRFKLISES